MTPLSKECSIEKTKVEHDWIIYPVKKLKQFWPNYIKGNVVPIQEILIFLKESSIKVIFSLPFKRIALTMPKSAIDVRDMLMCLIKQLAN